MHQSHKGQDERDFGQSIMDNSPLRPKRKILSGYICFFPYEETLLGLTRHHLQQQDLLE